MKSVVRVIMAGMILCAVPAFAQTAGTADTNMEIFMQKIKADKKLLVASNMGLTDAEGKDFWPVYEAYQKDLQQVNERLGKTIDAYAQAYNEGKGTVSNDTAKKLLEEAISVEEQEVKLKRTYAEKVGKVLPAAKTARYIQIENKIRAVIKFQLAQQIPLVY
ncbi:MAG TPA: hypothetical protein VLM19_08645 [Nitrospiraceae bacterium]|nr:hypothetical protein [Nitrospiraceae bacterium]